MRCPKTSTGGPRLRTPRRSPPDRRWSKGTCLSVKPIQHEMPIRVASCTLLVPSRIMSLDPMFVASPVGARVPSVAMVMSAILGSCRMAPAAVVVVTTCLCMAPTLMMLTTMTIVAPLSLVANVASRISQSAIADPVIASLDAVADSVEFMSQRVLARGSRHKGEQVELFVDQRTATVEPCVIATGGLPFGTRRLVAMREAIGSICGAVATLIMVSRNRRAGQRKSGDDHTAHDENLDPLVSSVLRMHRIFLHAFFRVLFEDFVLVGRDLRLHRPFRPTGDLDVLLQGGSASP